jgi:glycosyltransferase involved in cell wall biosynthesis
MKIKIGIVSRQGIDQSATDRFRYDPLARGLSSLGYQINYFDPNQSGYDVIILPLKKKPNLLPQIKQTGAVIIGDITDDMLSYPVWYHRLGRYLRMAEKFSQRQYYIKLLKQCDWIVAGSAGQADSFRNYAQGVSVVTDAILNADTQFATNYAERKLCRLVWFGNVESLHGLVAIQPALAELARLGRYELNLITSPETKFRLVGRWPHNVYEFMTRQQIPCRFQPWSATTYAQHLAGSDIALVPVEPGTDYNWHKPAGRALLAMALGLPVVASAIPAYKAVIEQGQTGYIARPPAEWVHYVEQLARHPTQRETIGLAARQFALNNYSEQKFVQRYSDVIQQALSKTNS